MSNDDIVARDIVARLRDDYQKTVSLCTEAAAYIERLRVNILEFEATHGQNMREIERLRKCIKSISDASMFPEDAFQKAVHDLCNSALNGGGDD